MKNPTLISGKPTGGSAPANGNVPVYNATTGLWEPGSASSGGAGPAYSDSPGATTWTIPGAAPISGTMSTVGITADRVEFMPIVIHRAATLTALGIEVVATSAGATAVLGIYRASTVWQAAALLASETVSLAAAGRIATTGISLALDAGPYFLAFVPSSSVPTVGSMQSVAPITILTGLANVHLIGAASNPAPLANPGVAWTVLLNGSPGYFYKVFCRLTPS